jgi:hypothetical protein
VEAQVSWSVWMYLAAAGQDVTHWEKDPFVKMRSVARQTETHVRKVSETCANLRNGQLVAFAGVSQTVIAVEFTVVEF